MNLAWLLNPGHEIRVFGNEWGSLGHFNGGADMESWSKDFMWRGLRDLVSQGLKIVDCNRHVRPLPGKYQLPIGSLTGPESEKGGKAEGEPARLSPFLPGSLSAETSDH